MIRKGMLDDFLADIIDPEKKPIWKNVTHDYNIYIDPNQSNKEIRHILYDKRRQILLRLIPNELC